MVSWIITRHALFLLVILSTYFDTPRLIPRVWDLQKGHYMTKGVYVAFVIMLVALQVCSWVAECSVFSSNSE